MKTWETKSGCRISQILSGRSNVFLITKGKKNILIGTSPENKWNKLEKKLIDLNINNIDFLILTHTHFDHAANAYRIKKKYNAQVFVHETEASYLTTGNNIIPNGTNIITRSLIKFFAASVFRRLRYEPCQPDVLVNSSLNLKEFGFEAYIIHTPGHTIGSMSIVVDNEVALVGDTMFGISKWSVFPPYANDVKQMVKSWGKLLNTNCPVFIPSHGSANSRSLVQNDFDRRNK
jgi:glyoxylase-like metal-dependent hydrolase (beta-lactamase superfamily II)